MDASAKFLVIVALAAFVSERALAAAAYVIDTVRYVRMHPRAKLRVRSKAVRRFVLAALAGVIAWIIVQEANVRLLAVLKIDGVHRYADVLVSWLAVTAGADRVRSLLKGDAPAGGAAARNAPAPLFHLRVNDGRIEELRRTT